MDKTNPIESFPEPWKSHLLKSQSLLDKNDVLLGEIDNPIGIDKVYLKSNHTTRK